MCSALHSLELGSRFSSDPFDEVRSQRVFPSEHFDSIGCSWKTVFNLKNLKRHTNLEPAKLFNRSIADFVRPSILQESRRPPAGIQRVARCTKCKIHIFSGSIEIIMKRSWRRSQDFSHKLRKITVTKICRSKPHSPKATVQINSPEYGHPKIITQIWLTIGHQNMATRILDSIATILETNTLECHASKSVIQSLYRVCITDARPLSERYACRCSWALKCNNKGGHCSVVFLNIIYWACCPPAQYPVTMRPTESLSGNSPRAAFCLRQLTVVHRPLVSAGWCGLVDGQCELFSMYCSVRTKNDQCGLVSVDWSMCSQCKMAPYGLADVSIRSLFNKQFSKLNLVNGL